MDTSQVDIEEVLERIDRFLQEEIVPIEHHATGHAFYTALPYLEEKRERVKELGLWCPQIPSNFGGLGLGLEDFGKVSSKLGQSPIGHYVFNCQAPDAGNMEILIEHGTSDQQEQFLQPLLRGETRSCFSMTEPDHAGSNPVFMSTTAKREGDVYIINGKKWFTTAADGAAFAVVMVITDPEAENPYKRTSQIIVPTDTPGFKILRNIPVMGDAGEGWMSHSEIVYENCRVPVSNLLGEEGAGFAIAQERLGPGRIHHCMRWMGICERAFDMMCKRAASRELSPGIPLAFKQSIQHYIAESRAEINAARLMVLDTARKMEKEGHYAARAEVSLIKFFAAGVLDRVLDRAVQIHGALGMTDDLPLAGWFRHERAGRIYDGADEVHKTSAARQIMRAYGLKLPR